MAKLTKKTPQAGDLTAEIQEVFMGDMRVCLLGTSPLIMNRLSEKARHELLLPAPPKNKAERQIVLKHDPIAEFRSSVYRNRDDAAPTRLCMPGGAFHKALSQTAIDIPGATKAAIGRLTSIAEINVNIFGLPRVFTAIVRQAGPSRTPDVRTRAMLPEWACMLSVSYVASLISERNILNLLGAAGIIVGIGDFRTEKGAGSFGAFACVSPDNADFQRVVETGNRAAQDAALENPVAYDLETEELLGWFDAEVLRREKVLPSKRKKRGDEAATEVVQ